VQSPEAEQQSVNFRRPAASDISPQTPEMVFIFGGRRRRGGFGPGYGSGYDRGGGGSCLRDMLFLDAGCCLADSLGCGNNLMLLAPTTVRHVHRATQAEKGQGAAARMIAAVHFYQREISPRRGPVCRFTPTCSAYAVEAIDQHGVRRGAWLTARRLLRCRPGVTGGADPVPVAPPHAA
jgi:uncharacterized protein